jgi:hypothetical protein
MLAAPPILMKSGYVNLPVARPKRDDHGYEMQPLRLNHKM